MNGIWIYAGMEQSSTLDLALGLTSWFSSLLVSPMLEMLSLFLEAWGKPTINWTPSRIQLQKEENSLFSFPIPRLQTEMKNVM